MNYNYFWEYLTPLSALVYLYTNGKLHPDTRFINVQQSVELDSGKETYTWWVEIPNTCYHGSLDLFEGEGATLQEACADAINKLRTDCKYCRTEGNGHCLNGIVRYHKEKTKCEI